MRELRWTNQAILALASLTGPEQRAVLERLEKWRSLDAEDRARMREAFREALEGSPEARQEFMERLRRWRELSPAERERLREQWRQRRENLRRR